MTKQQIETIKERIYLSYSNLVMAPTARSAELVPWLDVSLPGLHRHNQILSTLKLQIISECVKYI